MIILQYNNNQRNHNNSEELDDYMESINNDEYGDDYYVNKKSEPNYNNIDNNLSKKKSKKLRILIRVIIVVLIIMILLFLLFAALTILRVNYTGSSPDSSYISSLVGELKTDNNVENIMLFGADNHTDDEYGRSDSMILISVDKKNHIIKQTSFLRDLYVEIPGYGEDRLNAAFALGGAKLAAETIEYNFKIKIDSYIVLDFSGFTAIIDAADGIELELTADEIDYINWQCWRNKQVETKNELNIDDYNFYYNDNENYVAKVKLNGRQTLWYARDRDSEGSDFDRTARQRIVIGTLIEKLKSSNPITLMKVAFNAAPMITTDMPITDVTGKLFSLTGYLKYDRSEYRVPRSDNFYNDYVYGAAVLRINDYQYEIQKLYEFIYQ